MLALGVTACQDKDIEVSEAVLAPASESDITGALTGNDYVWTWNPVSGMDMQVSVYIGGTLNASEIVSDGRYVHRNIDTNVEYTYVFKLTDGKNLSTGVVKHYIRLGASQVTGIMMSQLDKEGGYDAKVEWTPSADAVSVIFSATNGSRTIDRVFTDGEESYLISDVNYGEECHPYC